MLKNTALTILFLSLALLGAGCSDSDKPQNATSVAGEYDNTGALVRIPADVVEKLAMPDRIETRIGTLKFFDGFPTDETARIALDYLVFMRGVDVFLDEMRAASMVALREGHRELGVTRSNQVIISEQLFKSDSVWLTPNTETVYVSAFLDLKADGPTVIESPPNVLGFLDDMWMRYIGDIGNAGPDRGQGGKYLLVPPDYSGEVPEGYYVLNSRTYGVWLVLRGFLVNGDPAPAIANFKDRLRIYALADVANPPEIEYTNFSGRYHNTVHSNDFSFFEELNALIQEEHDDAIDAYARGRLALLGIEKGKKFDPDEERRKTLDEAARVGATIARSLTFASDDDLIYLYPEEDRTWFNPFAIGNHEFMTESGWLHRDARSVFMYVAIGITPAMAIAMPGVGSQYAGAFRDANGQYLDGSKTYRLTLPPNIPAKNFWSIVLYDPQTRSTLQTDNPFPSLNSLTGNVTSNADGSVDIYLGPEAPDGDASNWIQTMPGKGLFLIFRLYGPLEPWFDKTWRPGKVELIHPNG